MVKQVGLTIPLQLSGGSCPLTNSREELLLERIANIVETPKFQPKFSYRVGCRLSELLGEPTTDIIPMLAKQFVQSAFNELDCGVVVTEVTTSMVGSNLKINIYMIDKLTGKPLTYNTVI